MKIPIRKNSILFLCLLLTPLTYSCESRAGSGALGGAVVGGVVGGVAGGGTGVLIGAGAGAVGGAIIGAALDASDKNHMNPEIYQKYKKKEPLTIDDIITLSQQPLSDQKIVHMIDRTNSTYCNLSRKDISKMKRAGVKEDVIQYMRETCNNK